MSNPQKPDGFTPVIALAVVAGSASETLSRIAQAFVESYPGARFVVFDMEGQVLDRNRRDTLVYKGPGTVGNAEESARPPLASRIVTRLRRGSGPLRAVAKLATPVVRAIGVVSRPHVKAAHEFLKSNDVDIVLTCNDLDVTSRSFLHAAHVSGIPTVLIQEGPFSIIRHGQPAAALWAGRIRRKAGRLRDVSPDLVYGGFGHARLLCVSTEYRDRFIAEGIDPATIVPIGTPRFDSLYQSHLTPPAQNRLTYVFQPFLAQGRVHASALPLLEEMMRGINAAWERQNFRFTIKLHPRSDAPTIERLRNVLTIPHDIEPAHNDLQALLRSSSAVIGHYSTGLLEALALARPVVCVPIAACDFDLAAESDKQRWFERIGIAVAVRAPRIADAVCDALNEPVSAGTVDIIAEEAGPIDGGATARAVQEIAALLRMQG